VVTVLKLLLKICYTALPQYDNEFGGRCWDFFRVRRELELAGAHTSAFFSPLATNGHVLHDALKTGEQETWDRLYIELDIEPQLDLSESDKEIMFRPRKTYTSNPHPSW